MMSSFTCLLHINFNSPGLLDYEDHDAQCAEQNAVLTSKKPVKIDSGIKGKMMHFARDFSAPEAVS